MIIRKTHDLNQPAIIALLSAHMDEMIADSPPESVHALDLDGLSAADVTFWSAWDGNTLVGCGALKALDSQHGEIKSMRTASAHLRKGVGARILTTIIREAQLREYKRLSLETGSAESFAAARRFYERFGFSYCEPFADYGEDEFSVYMTRML